MGRKTLAPIAKLREHREERDAAALAEAIRSMAEGEQALFQALRRTDAAQRRRRATPLSLVRVDDVPPAAAELSPGPEAGPKAASSAPEATPSAAEPGRAAAPASAVIIPFPKRRAA